MSQVENTAVVEDDEDDFLSNIKPQEVPKACSIDNPDCEACQ